MRATFFRTGGPVVALLANLALPHALINPPLQTVQVGVAPTSVTIDEQTGRAFVVNQGPPYTISVLDARTGRVLRTVAVSKDRLDRPAGPVVVDTRRRRALVVNAGSESVSVFDATTGRLLRIIPLGFQVQYLALDEVKGLAFIPNTDEEASDAEIAVLDIAHMRIARTVPLHGGALVVDERTGYVFIRTAHGVSMFDATTGRVLQTAHVAGLPVALDAATHRVFVLKGSPTYTISFALTVLDTRSAGVVRTLPLPLETTYSLVVDSHRNRAFLAVGTSIDVVDTVTGRLLRTIVVNRGLSSFSTSPLAVDTRTGHVYALSMTLDRYGAPSGPGYLRIFDPGTGAQLRTIRVGSSPIAIALDNRAMRAFIVHAVPGVSTQLSSGSRGKVTVLDDSHL